MNITDQLAQALEELRYKYSGFRDSKKRPEEERAWQFYDGVQWGIGEAINTLSAYRASKEGEQVEYRFLDEGERPSAIKGDQVKFAGEWRPWTSCSVRPVESHETTVFRRPIRVT